jgi:gamma-glutamyltranspeptidase/glutathione hydrolase
MATQSRWQLGRSAAHGTRGMVSAKTSLAAQAGAAVLARGGNAVDAAATTAAVAWVVEPWMNGLGGGGYMIVHQPGAADAVIEFPMVAAAGVTQELYPLAARDRDTELFGWATVVDNANIHGPRSIAIPGSLAGIAMALERFGTISLAQALEPAIVYAEDGVPVTWHWSYEVARYLPLFQLYEGSRALYLNAQGQVPWSLDTRKPLRQRNPDLAKTLRTIADQGPGAFYEGETAATIASYLSTQGMPIAASDFANYRAQITTPLSTDFHGTQLLSLSGATGGTTMTEALRLLAPFDLRDFGHNSAESLHLIAEAFKVAFADRFAYLADPTYVDVPYDALLSAAYLDSRRAGINQLAASPARAGDRGTLGVSHDLATSIPEYTSGGSTTHLSAMDASGMAVTVTQTLLSLWGSAVVVPETGVLMNNGMMWFDPEPGRPNSIAGGKRPLSNMSPALLLRDGEAVAALGASGGRRIIGAVAQVAMNLIDHGMNMQEAVSAPRTDSSTPELIVSDRIDAGVIEQLRNYGHRLVLSDETLLGADFASPACIQRLDGGFIGGVDQYYFPATAAGVD